jgi:hypothetical protein
MFLSNRIIVANYSGAQIEYVKIPSAYKSYDTISLYNAAPHRGTAFSTYYLSSL